MPSDSKLQCRSEPCKYHGHAFLVEWCRHPRHLVPLDSERQRTLQAAGGRCKDFIDWEKKVMPGEEPPWPMPVIIDQLIAVLAQVRPDPSEKSEKSDINKSPCNRSPRAADTEQTPEQLQGRGGRHNGKQ